MMDDVDDVGVEDAFDLDLGGQLLEQQLLEDVALWQAAAKKHDMHTAAAAAAGQQAARKGGRSSSPAALGLSSDSDSNLQGDATALLHSRSSASAHAAAGDVVDSHGLPQISKLLHDNPSCASGSHRQGERDIRLAARLPDSARKLLGLLGLVQEGMPAAQQR